MTNVTNRKDSFDSNLNDDIPVRTKNILTDQYSGSLVQVIEVLNQLSGFATEDKLEAVRVLLNNINSKTIDTSAIAGTVSVSNQLTGFATDAKLDLIKSCLDLIEANTRDVKAGYTEALLSINTTAPTNTVSANTSRKGGFIQNLSDVDMYVNETGATINNTDFFTIFPQQNYYIKTTNAIKIICASGSAKKARIAQW